MTSLELPETALPHTEMQEHNFVGLPDWDDFRLLLAVVQMGSFSRAATALKLTQPTVSRRVERLEETIGVRLVDRTNNGAALTLEGQRIVEQLHVAHGAIVSAVESVRSPKTRTESVKLATTDGLAAYWMPHFMPSLFEQYRDVELRTYTGSDAEGYQRGHFDLSIHYMAPNDPNLMTTRLGTLHFIPYASPAYLTRYGWPRTVADLGRHRLLDYVLYLLDKGSWMTRLPGFVAEGRTQFFTNSSAVLCETVRKGAGIALLPTYISVFEQDLVALDVGLHFETPFWLCYHRETLAKPGAQVVVQFLKHIFNRKTMPWFADQYISPMNFPRTMPDEIMAGFSPMSTMRTPAIVL